MGNGTIICIWGILAKTQDFRIAFSELAILRAIFKKVSILALSAILLKKVPDSIITGLKLNQKKLKLVRELPNRPNIYLAKALGVMRRKNIDSHDTILIPIATELKAQRIKYPLTVTYLDLQWCGYAYRFFERILGED